jgi:tetratricopeptide (TPR) repeat protein
MATCLSNLGGVQLTRKDYAAARATFTRAADIYERNLGPDHPKVGLTLANLGEAERLGGDLERAVEVLERSVRIVEATLGPEHPRLAYPVGRLGLVLGTSDPKRAIVLIERALELGSDIDVVSGERDSLEIALARAIVATGGDIARARSLATHARETTTKASDRREIDRWLATLPL